jgi:hypothetical protein
VTFKIKTTFSGSMTHVSPQISVVIACGNSYTISAVSGISTPQYVTHGSSSVGFQFPAFTHPQTAGCPINNWELSASGSSVTSVSGMALSTSSGSGTSTVKIAKPSNTGLHQAYTFYLKVSALGGSNNYFGPYVLNVGCFAGAVSYSDSGSLDTNLPLSVGAATAGAYTFANPTATRSWCTPVTNTIVQNDAGGTAWSGSAKLTGSGS